MSSKQILKILCIFSSDLDECGVSNGGCSQICRNVRGAHECDCVDGYRLADDQRTCNGKKYVNITIIMKKNTIIPPFIINVPFQIGLTMH